MEDSKYKEFLEQRHPELLKEAEIEGQIEEKTRSMRNHLKKITSEIDSLKKEDE